jgi:hypothetical protein
MPCQVPDIYGKNKLGVQIRHLKSVFEQYDGKVYIGKLIQNPLYYMCPLKNKKHNTPKMIEIKMVEESGLSKNFFESEIDQMIAEIKKVDLGERITQKTIQHDFDEILKEMENVEQLVDNLETNEETSPSASPSPSPSASPSPSPSPVPYIQNPVQETIQVIQKNLEESQMIQKQIEESLDDLFLEYNKMIMEKIKESKGFEEMIQKMKRIEKIYGNRVYNMSLLDLLSALYPVLRPLRGLKYKVLKGLGKIFQKSKKIKEEKLFCSQFVAIVYKELGLIDRKMNVKNFVPVDFLGVDEDGQKNIVSNIFKIC